jgi:septal ring factor EnvC (AmiA/AmiB activator)
MTKAKDEPSKPERKRAAREPGDLERRLATQLEYIDSSAKLFDEGRVSEAVRLAGQLRVLGRDGQHPSLLNLLGLKDSLKFVGTAIDRAKLTAAHTELLGRPPLSKGVVKSGFYHCNLMPMAALASTPL